MSRSLMNILRRVASVAGIASIAFGLAACGPDYERTEISSVKGAALSASLDTQQLSIPEGLILTAHIAVWDDDNVQMDLGVRSKDPSLVEVALVVNERNYSFIAHKEGQTEIEFLADGEVVLTIPATVTKQPALP